jgi:hypothetical protein
MQPLQQHLAPSPPAHYLHTISPKSQSGETNSTPIKVFLGRKKYHWASVTPIFKNTGKHSIRLVKQFIILFKICENL